MNRHVLDETLLKCGPLAKRLRRDTATVVRWITRGVPAATGGRVRLEAVKVGAVWCTSEEALTRFLERTNPPAPGTPPAPVGRTAAETERAVAAARAELRRMGVNFDGPRKKTQEGG